MAMMTVNGQRLQAHLEALADIARTPDGICRLSYSDSFWKSNLESMDSFCNDYKVQIAPLPDYLPCFGPPFIRLFYKEI